MVDHPDSETAARPTVVAVFLRFLRIGLCAWGGPTAQIAVLHQELVERERWVDEERFRRALAVYQALPGPEAHELCCWFGMVRRGRLGAIAAGLGFMLPGLLLMLAASWLYLRFGVRGPIASTAFLAVQATVIGLMIRALVRLTGAFARGPILAAIAVMAGVGQLLAVPFWIPLVIGGIAGSLAASERRAWAAPTIVAGILLVLFIGSPEAVTAASERTSRVGTVVVPSDARLFATGLSGGMLSFGGAYTAIPVVRDVAVGSDGWMSDAQFLDGLAIGGVLPSPLVIFATFVGFLGGGLDGALLMTLGMFLPAFGFTLIGHELFERVVRSPRARAFLDGVAAAFAGLAWATALLLGARTVGFAWESGPTLARPVALALIAVTAVAFFLLKGRWTMPTILLGTAAVGAVVGFVRG